MEDKKFKFTYSALTRAERQEIEDIRKTYLAPQQNAEKLDEIRKLDNKVKNIPLTISIIVAVIGVLTFGTGLSFILEWNKIIVGIIISIVGFVIIGLTHYCGTQIKNYLTDKYKNRILTLSEELLNEESCIKVDIKDQSKDKTNNLENSLETLTDELLISNLKEKKNEEVNENRIINKNKKIDNKVVNKNISV